MRYFFSDLRVLWLIFTLTLLSCQLAAARCLLENISILAAVILTSAHPETPLALVILRSGATKNLVVPGFPEILRFTQNDI